MQEVGLGPACARRHLLVAQVVGWVHGERVVARGGVVEQGTETLEAVVARDVGAVTNGRWFTPATVGVSSRKLTSSSRLSRKCVMVISWQSPTVFTRLTGERPADRGHRVGEVEGAASGHCSSTSRDVDEHRDVAQRTRDPAGPHRVADRRCRAVPGGDVEVVAHRREATGRDGDDHVVGPLERRPAIGGSRPWLDAPNGREVLGELDHLWERLGIDVVQNDLGGGGARVARSTRSLGPTGSCRHR